MKSLFSVLFIGCFLLVAAVCHAEEEMEPNSADHYRTNGVTIVTPVEWKPFAFPDVSGNHVGYAIDFWNKWSEKTEVPIRFVFKDWPDTLEAMKNREADIHCGVYYSDERTEYMEFSDSIYTGTSVLAIRNNSPVDCSNALAAGTVGVVENSYTAEYVTKHYTEANTVGFANSEAITTAFLAGEVDSVVTAYPPFIILVRERGDESRVNVCRTIFYLDAYAGVQKGQTELLKLVNDGMAEITNEELQRIEALWFVPSEEPSFQWLPAVMPAAIALVLLVGTVVLWVSRRR